MSQPLIFGVFISKENLNNSKLHYYWWDKTTASPRILKEGHTVIVSLPPQYLFYVPFMNPAAAGANSQSVECCVNLHGGREGKAHCLAGNSNWHIHSAKIA